MGHTFASSFARRRWIFPVLFEDIVLADLGITGSFTTNLITAIVIILICSMVIFGGVKHIGKVAGSLVPMMALLYICSVSFGRFGREIDLEKLSISHFPN